MTVWLVIREANPTVKIPVGHVEIKILWSLSLDLWQSLSQAKQAIRLSFLPPTSPVPAPSSSQCLLERFIDRVPLLF